MARKDEVNPLQLTGRQTVAAQPAQAVSVSAEPAKSPLEISHDNYKNMSINQQGEQTTGAQPRYLTREEGAAMGLGWQGRMAKYKEDVDAASRLAQTKEQNAGNLSVANTNAVSALARENISQQGATLRQQMGDDTAINATNIREKAQTGRQKAGDDAALERLAKGHAFTLEQMASKEKYDAAGDHRKAATAALVAGAPGAQVNQLANANPGFPVDYSGVQVPLKNTQQDQFQFVTRDNQAGQPQSIMVGNKQTGQLVEAPAVSALSSGAQQPAAAPVNVKQPAAPDAYAKIYQSNPQRLQEDVASAAAQIGTVYKTDEDQLAYLNATRKTNPTLFLALKQHLGQQQAVAR